MRIPPRRSQSLKVMREKDKVNNRSSEQSDEIKRTYMLAGPSIRYLQRSASFANFPTEAPAPIKSSAQDGKISEATRD